MNQTQDCNYQYYEPSYNNYQGQWRGQSYNSQEATSDQTYYRDNHSPESSYNFPSYTSPRTYSTPCMGQCNPPKLYADTYNYLTENLMRPVIEEVYHDLKNITSANAVANHSLASKIGLEAQGQAPRVTNQETDGQK